MKKLPHQKCTGMTTRYTNARIRLMHHHEAAFGDARLYQWVMAFKPFLQWGKPVKLESGSFRAWRGVLGSLEDNYGGSRWTPN